MVVTIIYQDRVIESKRSEVSDGDYEQFAEAFYQPIDTMNGLKIETPEGFEIIPAAVLKNSIILVDK